MKGILFPEATQELLFLSRHEDPAKAIEEYLERFSVKCGRAFMRSLTQDASVVLFSDDELLENIVNALEDTK